MDKHDTFLEQNIYIPRVSPSQNCEAIISERVHNVRSRDFIRAIYGYGNCISRMRKELSSLYYPWHMVCYTAEDECDVVHNINNTCVYN